jgi:CubicO group peptidase (beta-lactamase class C family)
MLVALLLAAAATPLAAQRPGAGWGPYVDAFDAFVRADSIVGAGTVLVQGGRAVAHHETGFADRELNQRADERSIYHWASITKTLTAVAILQLRDRGKLALDDPVVRWVPELRLVHDPFGAIDAVTIRMLLSHTAGFQNPTWPYTGGRPWEPFEPTRWEQLVAMMPYQEVAFVPGTRWSYSNPAFIYLARIIEAVSGDPWEGYVYKNIFLPLGMTRSYFGATPYHLAGDRANNYTLEADSGRERVHANGRDFDPGITIPNGGWNAPLADVVTWMAFLDGAHPDDAVLKAASLAEMRRPVIALPADNHTGDAFGLALFLRGQGDQLLAGHTGEQAGFRSFMFFNPRTGNGIIANFNTTNDAHPRESNDRFMALLRQAQDFLEGR